MHWAASQYLATRRVLQEVIQNGRFLQEERWVNKILTNEKKRLLLGQDGGKAMTRVFITPNDSN